MEVYIELSIDNLYMVQTVFLYVLVEFEEDLDVAVRTIREAGEDFDAIVCFCLSISPGRQKKKKKNNNNV